MSPDEIFASQMWNWPDPMLKRDPQGRIVFVNAAFLQMYGGSVADWQGNVVGGWPAPVAGPTPMRFETRMPQHDTRGQPSERIYDWMEYVMADGHALGFARDVTDLLTPTDVPPGDTALPNLSQDAPQNTPNQSLPAAATAPLAAHATMSGKDSHENTMPARAWEIPQDDASHDAHSYDTAAQSNTGESNPERHEGAVTQAEIAASAEPQTDPQSIIHETVAPTAEAPISQPSATEGPTASNAAPATPQIEAPQTLETQTQAPYVQDEAPVRDHERRALPIENGDAVLGTNWRDAVIAKAVGAGLQRDTEAPDAEAQQPAVSIKKDATAPAPKTEAPAASDIKSKSDLRILLAEDNAINALLTRTLLEAEGCTVDVVEDGALAVEAVKNASYDMIFMDMRMPNMDGLESTRKIRSLQNVPSDLPIVALTANAFDDDRNACFDSGMNDFMTKPVSAEELSEMVERWAMRSFEQRMAS